MKKGLEIFLDFKLSKSMNGIKSLLLK